MGNGSIESNMQGVSARFENEDSGCEASIPYHELSLVDLSKNIRLVGIMIFDWNRVGFLCAFGPAIAAMTKGRRFCLSALRLHIPDGFAEILVLPSF